MDPAEQRNPIYFKRELAYDREQQRLKAWRGADRNKELIAAYQQFLFVKGSHKVRAAKVTYQLRVLCDRLQKPMDKAQKADIEALVAWVNQNEAWSIVTRSDYRRALKSFYNWFEEEDSRLESKHQAELQEARKLYAYLKKHVSTTYQKRALDYATIITDEDARVLIERGCSNSMERAVISLLHETGCRVGELLNIRLRDIERKGKYAMLRLDGKTGERRVPIGQCLPYLYQWMQDHPANGNPKALLWLSTHSRFSGHPLNYIGIDRLLKRTMRRAGIKKKQNAHWYRHSRATILASRYSEQILCKFMGWTLGSAQVRTYVHLNNEQVERAYQEENGIATPAAQEQKPQQCVCGAVNTPLARFCYRCGNALTIATILEQGDMTTAASEEAIQQLMAIVADPVRLQRFQEFMRQQRSKKTEPT